MKIIGVGLNKTGTTTLGQCLKFWGNTHCSWSTPAFELWRDNKHAELIEFARNYTSFEDWPWPLIYRELDEAFPGSKFILTRRSTPEVWFESLCLHAERTGPTEFRRVIYGYAMPHEHAEHHIHIYLKHNQAVRDYFAPRPQDFLEVCWEEGDEWSGLAKFLGKKIPNRLFPHANKRT
ncbi:MAG: sulfotransferase [Sumerlaeia bacterium]